MSIVAIISPPLEFRELHSAAHQGFLTAEDTRAAVDKYEMTLNDITDPNSDAAVRLLAEYTIAPRQTAELLALVENQTREPGEPTVTWEEIFGVDPCGVMRTAGEIVEEGRAYMRNRIAAILRKPRR